jgi:hypothetical protein
MITMPGGVVIASDDHNALANYWAAHEAGRKFERQEQAALATCDKLLNLAEEFKAGTMTNQDYIDTTCLVLADHAISQVIDEA